MKVTNSIEVQHHLASVRQYLAAREREIAMHLRDLLPQLHPDELLEPRDVALILGTSVGSVYVRRSNGRLRGTLIGHRLYFRAGDLTEFMATRMRRRHSEPEPDYDIPY